MGFLDRMDELSERNFIQNFRRFLHEREKFQPGKYDNCDRAYDAGRMLEVEAMHEYLNERLRNLDREDA